MKAVHHPRSLLVAIPLLAAIPLAGIALAGVPAQAAEQVPFTITEQVSSATFTATGPLCPSGTFADDVKVIAPTPGSPGFGQSVGFNLLIRTVYTCSDGSGTFNAMKHVFITFTDDGFTNTGPFQLLGGTGAFTGLTGHGVDNGVTSGNTGVGQISGFAVQG